MTRSCRFSLSTLLLLLTPFTLTQQIPVACSRAADVALSPKQPRPTADMADQVATAGHAETSFISLSEPANFGIARYRVADYADCIGTSGCYWNDLKNQTTRAEQELERLVKNRKPGENLALVLDIDETSLSSYCEEKREEFGFIASMFNTWIVSPEASIPIPGTLALYNRARALNVGIYFITGRFHNQAEATARNLKAAGYTDWTELILRDDSEHDTDTTTYKSNHRLEIAKTHRIILNVGDQWSDLNGPAKAEVSVKLPNPFYYLP